MRPLQQAKREFVRNYIFTVLKMTHGRTCEAARVAGMDTPNFCKLLRQHGVKASEFR